MAELRDARIARQRQALLHADAALRVFVGHERELIGRRVESFNSRGASETNLRLVADVIEGADLDYFLVPGRVPTRYVVGLRDGDRRAFLAAMTKRFGFSEMHVGRPAKSDRFAVGPVAFVDGELPDDIESSSVLRFGRFLLGPHGQLLAGLELGCDVEFWEDGAEFAASEDFAERQKRLKTKTPPTRFQGALVAPRPNTCADVLPAEACVSAVRRVGERTLPTFEAFAETLVTEVDFPIDVVYTWVDGSDPVWAAKRHRYRHGETAESSRLSGDSRYVSRDELRYSLRSLHTFAPFIRNIYIVTDGQTPTWLDTSKPGVTVVDHTDIFADRSALPVFNSHAIGTQLHHIDGLSEHYLYFNDDVFLGRPCSPSKYFHANGIAKLPFSLNQIGLGEPSAEDLASTFAGKNVRALLRADFDRFITGKFQHAPHPQRRSVAYELEERYAAAVNATARSRFRDPGDIAFASSLHHHYALLTGRGVPAGGKQRYIDIGSDNAVDRLERLVTERDAEFFCINDIDTSSDRAAEMDTQVPKFLERYFPYPAPWEQS